MSFVEKGEFTLESNFEEKGADPNLWVRIPHKRSGLSPLVFHVHLSGVGHEESFIRHDVLVQHGPVTTLTDHQMESAIARRTYPNPGPDFLDATFFQPDFFEHDRYKLNIVSTGFLLSSFPHSVRVGERYEWRGKVIDGYETADWFKTVRDEGAIRVFETGNNVKGSNRIALPKDLRPFVGHIDDSGKFVPPQKDLVTVVEFETYR